VICSEYHIAERASDIRNNGYIFRNSWMRARVLSRVCMGKRGGQRYGIFSEQESLPLSFEREGGKCSHRAINIHDLYTVLRVCMVLSHVAARANVCARPISEAPVTLQTEAEPSSRSPPPTSVPFRNGTEWGKAAGFAYIRRHTRSALISPARAGN